MNCHVPSPLLAFTLWSHQINNTPFIKYGIYLVFLFGQENTNRISIISIIFHAIYGAVYPAYPFLIWWSWENVYSILLSSKRKYEQFTIVYD